jgi:hypothetical protein
VTNRVAENRSDTVAPWTVLVRDDSRLLRCDVLDDSASYGRGAGRRAHQAGLRAVGATGVVRTMVMLLSRSSAAATDLGGGWPAMGKTEAMQRVDDRSSDGLAREGLWRRDDVLVAS